MKLPLKLIVPTILILAPTIFQIEFTSKRIKGKTRLSIFIIGLLTFAMGLPISAIATWLSMTGSSYPNVNYEMADNIGFLILLLFGIGINLIITIFIGIIGGFIQHRKRQIEHLTQTIDKP